MSRMIREALEMVIFNVLETMFFVIPERYETKDISGSGIEGKIVLTGETKVSLYIFMPNGLGLTLASNFLGKEREDIDDSEVLDLAREMVNMIGGNLVTKLDDERLILGLPDSRFVESIDKSFSACENKITLSLDDEPLRVLWTEENL
jgi:CheY-specific phosphatase CheX